MSRVRRAIARRVAPSAADQSGDVGPYGSRAPPPRLAPSIMAVVGPSAGGGVVDTIPEGTALVFSAGSQPTVGPAIVTVTIGSDQTFVQRVGASGGLYLRAADGFNGISWVSATAFAFLVVDTGLIPSRMNPGQNQLIPTDTQNGGVQSSILWDLGSAPFPFDAPLNAIAELHIDPPAGETWYVFAVSQGPSAAVAGTVDFWAEQAKVRKISISQTLAAAGIPLVQLAIPLEIRNPGRVSVNVTAAGADTAFCRIHGYRVQ